MLQGNTVKGSNPTPAAAGDVLQAIEELHRTISGVGQETGQLSDGLQVVLRAPTPTAEAKLSSVAGYATPLATTIQNLTEQLDNTRRTLVELNARLSI
jgi:hypothetical protein